MKKKLISFLILFLIALGSIVLVNETSDTSTYALKAEKCTRHCHNKGCVHFAKIQEDESPFLVKAYSQNIQWLKQNPLGLSYQAMNLLLYVIIWPIVFLFLFWSLIRKRHG